MSDPFDLTDEPEAPALSISQRARQAMGAPEPADMPWLDGLNPEQRAAVTTTEGPVLVLSGAGTGKTRVLTTRLAYLLATHKAQPWHLLAVTFTNRAAKEMRERVADLIGPAVDQAWLGTFHALGVKLLRRHAELVDIDRSFTILDPDDQNRLLKQIMEAEGVDVKKWTPQGVMGMIQRWKDRGLTPEQVSAGEASGEFAGGKLLKLYKTYQERLRLLNACDFGDLLLHCLTIFREHPDVLEKYQEQFRYILVDEYQDTNVAQYLWLRALAGKHKNICCVGDDDQSIYSWRGAVVDNILSFEKTFPGAVVIRLERNYRSTPTILKAASHLIARNEGRLGKELRSGIDGAEVGEKIVVRGVWDGETEARWVVEEIEAFQSKGVSLAEIAVLVRAGFQTREFEERLIVTGIPYRVIGGPRFYERKEIRDALAYLRCVVSPDDDLGFERIVNLPKRGLGPAALQALHQAARLTGTTLMRAGLALVQTDELKPKPRGALRDLLDDFGRWRTMLDGLPHAEVVETVLDESGYTEMWRQDKSPDAPGRLENLKELVAAVEEYDSLPGFLEHVALVMENDEKAEGERVSLMTLHSAKGLEFDVVFLPGWEEEIFPHQRALDEGGTKALEEERRLAYVGLTRARKRALVSFAARRRVFNQYKDQLPSRFVDELPPDQVEVQSDQGLYAGQRAYGAGWGDWDAQPAWGGAAERRTAYKTPTLDGEATWKGEERSAEGFAVGDRVFHEKFGYGTVTEVEGQKLTVGFDKSSPKKVMAGFVTAV